MVEVEWTPQAVDDLDSIARFIAKDSPQYARLFVSSIFQAVERVSVYPRSGRVVPELGNSAVREVILGNYRVVYRLEADLIAVLTVYHGSRLFGPDALG